ncbi:sigma-70 family RNA polymerase sigma factor [Microbacterium sp. NPDC076895]|uniref:RNA polymerase sigma factor n=1 Tax=Microbacterium sp. NPDC076895 TaxID=3154957 RepID=UPI00342B283A
MREFGRNGTHNPSFEAVEREITKVVSAKYAGWPAADREDLVTRVMESYFHRFGRDPLPQADDGTPLVPKAWLRTVITNAAIDMYRHTERRPADPVDFAGIDDPLVEERLHRALDDRSPSLSTLVATRITIEEALKQLAQEHPRDVELIVWSVVADLPIDEVALRAGISRDAAKKAVRRALDRLRDVLERDGR